jgi:hypothetical protein
MTNEEKPSSDGKYGMPGSAAETESAASKTVKLVWLMPMTNGSLE